MRSSKHPVFTDAALEPPIDLVQGKDGTWRSHEDHRRWRRGKETPFAARQTAAWNQRHNGARRGSGFFAERYSEH